jgi:methylornithine synthase
MTPGAGELETLLGAGDEVAPAVFAAAREMRSRCSGDAIFLYGFVYFSTYCRNDCAFCFYRSGNMESPRYRKSLDEVVAICRDLAASGVVLLDLTLGEDPAIHDDPGYAGLLELVAAVAEGAGLPLMVSPGVLPENALVGLRAAGADWYALYQETHTPELYDRLRAGQPFAARVAARIAGGGRAADWYRRHHRRSRALHRHDARSRVGAGPRDDVRAAGRHSTRARRAGR